MNPKYRHKRFYTIQVFLKKKRKWETDNLFNFVMVSVVEVECVNKYINVEGETGI